MSADGRALAAWEPCGCLAAISVLDNHPADAYEMAAEHSRRGARIEEVSVEAARVMPWKCQDHPKGPPWWESNGGNGKVPAEYVPQPSLGL